MCIGQKHPAQFHSACFDMTLTQWLPPAGQAPRTSEPGPGAQPTSSFLWSTQRDETPLGWPICRQRTHLGGTSQSAHVVFLHSTLSGVVVNLGLIIPRSYPGLLAPLNAYILCMTGKVSSWCIFVILLYCMRIHPIDKWLQRWQRLYRDETPPANMISDRPPLAPLLYYYYSLKCNTM